MKDFYTPARCILYMCITGLALFNEVHSRAQCALLCPPDTETTCDALSPDITGYAELTGCSGFASYTDEVEPLDDCHSLIHRHWHSSGYTCTQLIYVTDNLPPVFGNTPPDLWLDCSQPVPEAAPCVATDYCGTVVFSHYFEGGTQGLEQTCTASTAYGPGPDWSLWLPGLGLPNANWHFLPGAQFHVYADGTAHLHGVVSHSTNPALQWQVDVWLENGRNWADWSALGRYYKDDLGLGASYHEQWTYYEMAGGFSHLTGMGTLAGSQLLLYHAPANYYFGYQLGLGANNKNSNYGLSGWFTYEGWMQDQWVNGIGDINTDLQCEPSFEGCATTDITRIWMATDACGYTDFAQQLIHITDTQAPVVQPYEAVLYLDCNNSNGVFITAIDDCSQVNVTYVDEILEPGCNGTIVRHYTITDGCGNSTAAVQTIHLFGSGEPYFTSFPPDLWLECNSEGGIPEPNVQWVAGCDNTQLTVTVETVEGNCPGTWTEIHTYTLTDDCGHQVSQVWTVNITDQSAPVIFNVPFDVTIECGDAIPEAFPILLDNCDSSPIGSLEAYTVPMDCGYQFVRTWTVTDACGNTTDWSQVITVEDHQPPAFTFIPGDIVVDCAAEIPFVMATATDNCSSVSVSTYDEPLSGDCAGSFVRYFIATDGCGNSTMALQFIYRVDTTPPAVEPLPEVLEFSCGEEAILPEVQFSDNCSEATLTYFDTDLQDNGSYVRNYVVTDACGNFTHVQIQVIAIPDAPPSIGEVPFIADFACGEFPDLESLTPSVTDDCGEISLTYELNSDNAGCNPQYWVVWTATDEAGQSTSATSNIFHSTDNEPPVLHDVPADGIHFCGSPWPEYAVWASDNCGNVETISEENYQYNDCGYTVEITWTATDGCGNSAQATQLLTVLDFEPPQFDSFPEDVVWACDEPLDLQWPTFSDECSSVSLTFTDELLGDCAGSFVRTFLIVDGCGNWAEQSQTILLTDLVPPVFTLLPEESITAECSNVLAASDIEITWADNCSDELSVFINEIITEGDCPGYYTLTRRWTVTDGCGNSSDFSQDITVEDHTPPAIYGIPADDVLECGMDEANELELWAEDLCSEPSVVWLSDEWIEYTDCGYDYIRTYTAIDACGNESSTQHVTHFVDTTPPYFLWAPLNIEVSCSDEIPEPEPLPVADACDQEVEQYITHEYLPGPCPAEQTIMRIFRAYDDCGNSTVYVQLIFVVDDEGPEFDFEPYVEVPCEVTSQSFVQVYDLCSTFNLTYMDEVLEPGCGGQVLRYYTATDACGNTSLAQQIILPVDEQAPVFTSFPADIAADCGNIPTVNDITVQYTDNCQVADVQFTESFEDSFCEYGYTLVRTWTLTDACGNQTQQSWHIEVTDNFAPVFFGIPEDWYLECGDDIPLTSVFAVDNCTAEPMVGMTAQTTPTDCGSVIVRTWFVMDDCGNMSEASQTITISDYTAPVLSDYPADLFIECGEAPPMPADISAIDNCSGALDVQFSQTGDGEDCTDITRTWCAVDCAGNETCWTQTIHFGDGFKPAQHESHAKGDAPVIRQIAGAQGLLHINVEVMHNGPLQIAVHNMAGALIYTLDAGYRHKGEQQPYVIPSALWSAGLYMCTASQGSATGKLMFVLE